MASLQGGDAEATDVFDASQPDAGRFYAALQCLLDAGVVMAEYAVPSELGACRKLRTQCLLSRVLL
jgi:hypothetical protein